MLVLALLLIATHASAADLALSDAGRLAKDRGLAPTPQTASIERYLQTVGNRVAAHAPRSLRSSSRMKSSACHSSNAATVC